MKKQKIILVITLFALIAVDAGAQTKLLKRKKDNSQDQSATEESPKDRPTLKRRDSDGVAPRYESERGLKGSNPRSEQRFALVIGNSNYEIGPLPNPINDAQDIAQALKEVGFEVTYQANITKDEMKRAIKSFGDKIRDGGIGLFYYAGHGLQVKGLNYLVPVDAKLRSEDEVEYECVEVGYLIAQMMAASNEMNIIILDACRNNPFARSYRSISRGLAPITAPKDILVAYATGPDNIASDGNGRNGIYTQELLKNMRLPDLAVEEVFKRVRISVDNLTKGKQIPWESSSLTKSFYFTGSKVKNPAPKKEIQSSSSGNTESLPLRPKPQGQIVKYNFFTFELKECRQSGSTVSCEFVITNDDKDRRLVFGDYNSKVFDNMGNEGRPKNVFLANQSGAYSAEAVMVSSVPVKARVEFESISPQATKISLMSILCFTRELTGYYTDQSKVEFRNIPLNR